MLFNAPFQWMGDVATPENLIREAKTMEELGYYSINVGEHLFYPTNLDRSFGGSPHSTHLGHARLGFDPGKDANIEIFTCLAFVASQTSRIMLRSGIVVLPYRPPFVTAKQAATLDYLSNGRFILGVGAGWMLDEFEIMKVPFNERGPLTEEYIQIIRALCNDEPFEGRYYQFDRVHFLPKPVQQPLPIWIGGRGRPALRRVARYAQGWVPIIPSLEDLLADREILLEELETAERDISEIHIAGRMSIRFGDETDSADAVPNDRDRVLEEIDVWERAGVQSLQLSVGDYHYLPPDVMLERLQWFSEEVMSAAE